MAASSALCSHALASLHPRSTFSGHNAANGRDQIKSLSFKPRLVVRSSDDEGSMSDEDMSNVGLDDVFNLIEQATAADPEPENLAAAEFNRNLKSTPFSRWYKVYGRSAPANVDSRTLFFGPNRPLWKGSNTQPSDVPAYLKGEYPGDYGCDVLGLCKDKESYARLRAQELINARWAMLGAVGILYPEFVGTPAPGFEPVWFKTGAQLFTEEGIDYLGNPNLINAHSLIAIIAFQVVLVGGAELIRAQNSKSEDISSLYPGGSFDPLGLANDAESFAELQVKEIKNGRLAMLAVAGFFAQAAVTNEGPVANLYSFLKL